MHPALIASGLGTPVVSIPYCKKVRPTLTRIGVSDVILGSASVEVAMGMIEQPVRDCSAEWSRASGDSAHWLEAAVSF